MTHAIPDLSAIAASIDAVTASLATLPGRTPQNQDMATLLIELADAIIIDAPRDLYLNGMQSYGARPVEAAAIARALAGLALRLGAWLGRER